MPQFLVRVLSALFLLGTFLLSFFWKGPLGISLFISLVAALVFFEYHQMTLSKIQSPKGASLLFYLTGFLIFLNGSWSSFAPLFSSFLPSFLLHFFSLPMMVFLGFLQAFYISFSLWMYRKHSLDLTWKFLAQSFFGFFYCSLPPAFNIRVLSTADGLFWFVSFLIVVHLHDMLAYFVGRNFGKTKLMPQLSPRKTILGSLGGAIGAFLGLAFSLLWLFPSITQSIPLFFLIGVTALWVVSAQTGDFFESLLKRLQKLKDSGRILPGHGGMLDRMDSLYMGSFVTYAAALVSESYF